MFFSSMNDSPIFSKCNILQVTWDEPDLLQNVKRVSPWLVELVSNMPAIHFSPFSPPRKKLKLPHHADFPLDPQIPMPTFPSNFLGPTHSPFGCLPDNTPAGMQGARHAHQYGLSLSDLHLNKLQPGGLFPCGFSPLDHTAAMPIRPSANAILNRPSSSENVSCLLTMSNSTPTSKKSDNQKPSQFLLFGQPILTEQQISLSCSVNSSSEGNAYKKRSIPERASSEGLHWYKDNHREIEPELETGHCKVFMESEDVGRTLDLSLLGSYEELYRKLANMFGIESSEMLNHVLYRDVTGSIKQIGDEPFR